MWWLTYQHVGLPHRLLLLEDEARRLADARVVEHAAPDGQLSHGHRTSDTDTHVGMPTIGRSITRHE